MRNLGKSIYGIMQHVTTRGVFALFWDDLAAFLLLLRVYDICG